MLTLIKSVIELIIAAGIGKAAWGRFFGKKDMTQQPAGEGFIDTLSILAQVGLIVVLVADALGPALFGHSLLALLLNFLLNPTG